MDQVTTKDQIRSPPRPESETRCSEELEQEVKNCLRKVKANYAILEQEWMELQEELAATETQQSFQDIVSVKKDDLAQLATEITQFKQNLPKVLNKSFVSAVGRVEGLEDDMKTLREAHDTAERQVGYWKTRCETASAECQKEKQENLKLRCEMQELSQQLSQQSDYCSSLGAACCTLLWRVSRCEESIQSILVGTKVNEFLCLVSSTLESYLAAYRDDWPQEQTDETQFILALCGIITNIAASAYGRDFLITNQHGRQLLDTYITVLSGAPTGKSAKLKNLLLMSLYNISINQKGIKYIASKPGIVPLLAWLLQEERDTENRVNTLRLMQSILCDDANISIVPQLEEVLPSSLLQQLGTDPNKDVRELAMEIITDMRQLRPEI